MRDSQRAGQLGDGRERQRPRAGAELLRGVGERAAVLLHGREADVQVRPERGADLANSG